MANAARHGGQHDIYSYVYRIIPIFHAADNIKISEASRHTAKREASFRFNGDWGQGH